jgi:asparagine synthase (glutamine-hydrolysing)
MSAIAGVFYVDGRPVQSEAISRMVDVMRHRGPDRQDTWVHGSIGLGHGMLETTPESQHEDLPWQGPTSSCVITADVRIDNRDELMSALRLRPAPDEIVPDSTLILYAYEKWGEDCVDHLLGDFAFAIWDPNEQRLLCARDHMGVRPFYYYHSDRLFAFGSEIKALLTLEAVPRRLNEVRVADYLATMYEDKEITEYEGVWRLPPGHSLTIDISGRRKQLYWELEPGPTLQLGSDEAYAERLLELLEQAIHCRIRAKKPIAAELSGGLDSSFITCLAEKKANGHVHTISNLFPDTAAADEMDYIRCILGTSEKYVPHFINSEQTGFLSVLPEVKSYIDEGVFLSGAHHMMWETYRAVGKIGARVLLTGVDGDSAIDHGTLYLTELADQGRWKEFINEVNLIAERHTEIGETQDFIEELASPLAMVSRYAHHSLLQHLKGREYVRYVEVLGVLSIYLSGSSYRLLRRYLPYLFRSWKEASRHNGKNKFVGDVSIGSLKGEFANKINYHERYRQFKRENKRAVRAEQLSILKSGVMTTTLEACNQYTSAHGVEAAHPYMDVRLLEFAVRLPPTQSLCNGWTRAIMRRAMEGVVPDDVRKRLSKASLHPVVMKQINLYDAPRIGELVYKKNPLQAYLKSNQLEQLYENRRRLNAKGQWRLTFLANLSSWFADQWSE